MTHTIELPEFVEEALAEEAARLGVPVEEEALAGALTAWAEDALDLAEARRAIAEGGEPIPWEAIEAELGL